MKKSLLFFISLTALLSYAQDNVQTKIEDDQPILISENLPNISYSIENNFDTNIASSSSEDYFQTLVVTGGWDLNSVFLLMGVIDVQRGFAGGTDTFPDLNKIQQGNTDQLMAVKIIYDTNIISHAQILNAYFRSIDPTSPGYFYFQDKNFEKNVFYLNDEQRKIALHMIELLKTPPYFTQKNIFVEVRPFEGNFYQANNQEINDFFLNNKSILEEHLKKQSEQLLFWSKIPQAFLFEIPKYDEPRYVSDRIQNYFETVYKNFDLSTLKTKIPPESLKVIDEKMTEAPFSHEYSTNTKHGIYVDIVTGEPLFSSTDQIQPSNGWVCFTRAIDPFFLSITDDFTWFYRRKEVRSKYGNSHLGYLLLNKAERFFYRINGAALRFIPHDEMQENGYTSYIHL
ncbi:MAG: peptide-methionine (R)-S-oxide reductase [Brevinema sp.]